MISVRFLGYLRVALGRKDTSLELPGGASISMAMEELVRQLGGNAGQLLLSGTGTGYNVLFSVNDKLAEPTTLLNHGDYVTVYSPSAGGGPIRPDS